jgi:hypothetical protein
MAIPPIWSGIVVALMMFFGLPTYLRGHPRPDYERGSASCMLGFGGGLFHPEDYARRSALDEQRGRSVSS